jgi:signal transduction histidine kinase
MPAALALTAGLVLLEWRFRFDFSLGIFYTLPVCVAATALTRVQIVGFGIFCAVVRAPFTPAASNLESLLKFVMASIAYCCAGLLVVEMSNNRRRLLEHFARLRLEQDLRRHAEEQLRILVESSPAAILTINKNMQVEAANHAAHDMLRYPFGALRGKSVAGYFPTFSDALQLSMKDHPVRTAVSGWAKRSDDQLFPIQAWFSIYGKSDDRRLAAIVVDTSEDVRDRQRENFQHALDYNRLIAGAVSHEIRNLCSAITVVCSNLRRRKDLQGNADFEALNGLVEGLSRLASVTLKHKSQEQPAAPIDLKSLLDQLRVVIEPDWEEADGTVSWVTPEQLPEVAGDAHGLLLIFLNLCQNSLRAVEGMEHRELTVSVSSVGEDAVITFLDTGHGVAEPESLFHPFRPEADGSGLGLFVSRELARSFGGDLTHVPRERGAEFRVIVPRARASTGVAHGAW